MLSGALRVADPLIIKGQFLHGEGKGMECIFEWLR